MSSNTISSLATSFHRLWYQYWLGDWCFLFTLVIIEASIQTVSPHHQEIINPTDPSILYPLLSEEITVVTLFLLSVLLPLLIVIAYTLFVYFRHSTPSPFFEFHIALRSFFLCILSNLLCTDFIKKLVGRPRPNFLEMSGYVGNGYGCGLILSNSSACYGPEQLTSTTSNVREAFQSFVSGHASLAFAGLGWLAFWIHAKLSNLSDLHNITILKHEESGKRITERITGHNQMYRTFIAFSPLILAAYISITRVRDYWHREADVAIGSILGFALAAFSFHVHYYQLRWLWLGLSPPGTQELATVRTAGNERGGGGTGGLVPGSSAANTVASTNSTAEKEELKREEREEREEREDGIVDVLEDVEAGIQARTDGVRERGGGGTGGRATAGSDAGLVAGTSYTSGSGKPTGLDAPSSTELDATSDAV